MPLLRYLSTSDDGAGVGGGAPPQPLLHIRIRLDPQHPTCDHHLSSDGSISRESPDSKDLYARTTTTTIGRSLFKKIQLV